MKKQIKKFESIKSGKFENVAIQNLQSTKVKAGMRSSPGGHCPNDPM